VRLRFQLQALASKDWEPLRLLSQENVTSPRDVPLAKEAPGLELSVANAIVTAAEGVMRMDRSPGSAGEVEILLPSQSKSAENQSAENDAGFAARRGVVLLIGTDEATTLALEQHLEAERYVVIASASAAEALFVAQYYDGRVDVVIVDADHVSVKNRERSRAAFLERYAHTVFVCLAGDAGVDHSEWRMVAKPFQARDISSLFEELFTCAADATRSAHA